jgi:site-specific DNA recombinase
MVMLQATISAPSSDGVACYCRFSSKNQDDRTIQDQERQCKARAARDGFDPDQMLLFADEAVSGAKHSRKDFDRLMAAARQGQIKASISLTSPDWRAIAS